MTATSEIVTLVPEAAGSHSAGHASQFHGKFYRPELDVVRSLAFLLVFLHHLLPAGLGPTTSRLSTAQAKILYSCHTACGFGLSLFFTLSAYLICELLLREREATGAVHVKQFYIRRILRIWPLYFTGLFIGLVIGLLPGGEKGTIGWTACSALMLGNWFLISHGLLHNPMAPLWSISVEEQFYAFVPWVTKRLGHRSLAGFCVILILFANLWLYFLGKFPSSDRTTWFNSFVQFENFAAGMLLCLFLRWRPLRFSAWQRIGFIFVAALCAFYAAYKLDIRYQGPTQPSTWALIGGYGIVALGCCFVLSAFLGLDRKVLPAWAIYLGRISYGLYVFHELAMYILGLPFHNVYRNFASAMLFKGAGAGILTLLLASLSYRYLEKPFLKLKRHYELIESRPL